MNFFAFVQILGRRWWIVILSLVVVLGSTAFFSYRQTPIYETRTTLVVRLSEKLGIKETVDSLNALDRRSIIATYAKIPLSRTVQEKVEKNLGLESGIMSNQESSYLIKTGVIPDTNILSISVEGPDRRLVADIANAIAEESKNYVEEFSDIFRLTVLDRAPHPSKPVRPVIQRNLGIGVVLGLLLGVVLVFLIEFIQKLRHPQSETLESESKPGLYTPARSNKE